MDDRELEARLRTHLHGRLDDLDPPRELRRDVEQALASAARPVVVRGFRVRPRIQLGLSLAAAALVLVAALAAGLGLNGGIGGRSATPSPTGGASTATPAERSFLVLPPTAARPSKADSSLADDVLAARLQALGVPGFASAVGDAILFKMPGVGPSDDAIRAVLSATGEVEFVPLPPADYGSQQGNGQVTAVIGQPLPKPEPALFGREGVTSVAFENVSPGNPSPLDITLTAAAGQTVAAWSAGHVGEILAVVVDGKVVILPLISEPITGGSMTIQTGDSGPPFLGEGIAVLIGGELPMAWRGAAVPVLISRDAAGSAALAATHGGTIRDAELSGELSGGAWRAVWNVAIDNPGCSDVVSCASNELLVKIDATDGTVIQVQARSS